MSKQKGDGSGGGGGGACPPPELELEEAPATGCTSCARGSTMGTGTESTAAAEPCANEDIQKYDVI